MSRPLDRNKIGAALDEAAEAATSGSKLERAGRFVWVRPHERTMPTGKKIRIRSDVRPDSSDFKK